MKTQLQTLSIFFTAVIIYSSSLSAQVGNYSNSQFIPENDSIIAQALSLINPDSVESQLQWLQNMGTRFLMAENHRYVAESIKARYESYGMTEVMLDSFQCYTNITYGILQYDTTTWQYNVEARITGSLYPDEEIILLGHYDNVQINSDPELFCPGADDNASGTVAALETARVLMEMGYNPERTLVFLNSAAEELLHFGNYGTEHYVEEAVEAGKNIVGVINNDMIGFDNNNENQVLLSNEIGSEELTGIATWIVQNYTALEIVYMISPAEFLYDLQPFLDAGFVGLYVQEMNLNPYYHTEQDLIEHVNIEYLTEVIKISCGSLIYSDFSVGVDEECAYEMNISSFPNPCGDELTIICMDHVVDNYTISLFNTTGQLLQNFTCSAQDNMIRINMSGYSSDVYFLRVNFHDQVSTIKVIKK